MYAGENPTENLKEDPPMKDQKKSPKIGGTHADNPFQKARLKAGLSQERAAEKLSCAPRSVQRYEAGKTTPSYAVLRGMMDCYKCEAANLFADLPRPVQEPGGDAK